MGCSGCATGGHGCSHLLVTHDWLDNMLPPTVAEKENIYEIRFKATRKGYYRNQYNLDLSPGDLVAVDCDRGFDIGRVSMGGDLVRLQMKKKRINERHVNPILRLATDKELARLEELRSQEMDFVRRSRAIVATLNLDMKVSDIEFQADGSKAIFYYTAEARIDFRELIKLLANEFKTRVEMRQIGVRQEAGRVGGVGSCGRELCCSSWLTEFKSVNTAAARYQNLSINPLKITGLCGRLKCCLNYELETYMDALKSIPDVREIQTELGVATLQKTDIFQRKMWFSYSGDSNWVLLTADQVTELRRLNREGIIPPNLMNPENTGGGRGAAAASGEGLTDYVDVVGQSNLHERMAKSNKKRKKRSSDRPHSEAATRSDSGARPSSPRPPRAQGSRPAGERPPRAEGSPRPEGNRPPKRKKRTGGGPDREPQPKSD